MLKALPRIYQVTPDIPDRRRATQHKEVRPGPADSFKDSQPAARSGPSPSASDITDEPITTASLTAEAAYSFSVRISRDDLQKFEREVPPPPPPIEPLLPAVEEARLIAGDEGDEPSVAYRRARALAILRRAATPEGADAELLALLAAARALPLERREDRLSARQRLIGIGDLKDPPPEVRKLMRKLRTQPGDGAAFADALLRASQDTVPFHEGDFGSNYPAG